jgi:hypothetical protein
MARLALMAVVAVILVGCGSGGEGAKCGGRVGLCVTRAQVRRIKTGMSAKAALRLLPKTASGGQRWVQPFQYDYPIAGTGTGDPEGVGDGVNASYSYLTICVVGGRVVDTNRHHSLYQGDGCLVQERSEFVFAKRNHPGPLPPEFRTEAAWLLAGKPR